MLLFQQIVQGGNSLLNGMNGWVGLLRSFDLKWFTDSLQLIKGFTFLAVGPTALRTFWSMAAVRARNTCFIFQPRIQTQILLYTKQDPSV